MGKHERLLIRLCFSLASKLHAYCVQGEHMVPSTSLVGATPVQVPVVPAVFPGSRKIAQAPHFQSSLIGNVGLAAQSPSRATAASRTHSDVACVAQACVKNAEAHLSEAHLSAAHLSEAHLPEAHLSKNLLK